MVQAGKRIEVMEINANFDERVIVHGGKLEWIPSPMQGVDRRMLDRIGDEVARAKSIVLSGSQLRTASEKEVPQRGFRGLSPDL